MAIAIQPNNTPTMSDNGRPTMLANKSTTAGFSVEPGASNIIGDMSAMKPVMAMAGRPRIVSTMSHVRTGRLFETDCAGLLTMESDCTMGRDHSTELKRG